MKRILLISLFLCSLGAIAQQQPNFIAPLLSNFHEFHRTSPVEKSYFVTDREAYVPGDTVWINHYLVEGHHHTPSPLSNLIYIDMLSPEGEVLKSIYLKPNDLGLSAGDLIIPDTLSSKNVILRSYTRYLLNFEKSYLYVKELIILQSDQDEEEDSYPGLQPDVIIEAFPEGGNLVADLENKVAFKVTNEKGVPINCSGILIDGKGKKIRNINTRHDGLGSFVFTPEKKRKYFILIDFNGIKFTREIQSVMSEGYTMNVLHNFDRVYVIVQGSDKLSFKNSAILTQSRGVIYSAKYLSKEQDFFYTSFSKKELPNGISQVTFFDPAGIPRCERLIFTLSNDERPEVDFELPSESLKRREKFTVSSNVYMENKKVSGSMSVAVVPVTEFIPKINTIESYLLLSSDIKGHVYDPSQYFEDNTNDVFEKRDLLMMTHGWRRFNWDSITSSSFERPTIEPEQGFTIEGQVTGFVYRKKEKEKAVNLTFLEDKNVELDVNSSEDGTFKFKNLEIYNNATAILKTYPKRESTIVDPNTYIDIQHLKPPDSWYEQKQKSPISSYTASEILQKHEKIQQISRAFGDNVVILDEFEVEGKQVDTLWVQTQYEEPDYRVFTDSMSASRSASTLFDLVKMANFPGIRVVGYPPNQEVIFRANMGGRLTLNYLMDGTPYTADLLQNIPAQSIAMIDVLRGTKSSVYGTNLTIAFYSKKNIQGPERGFDTEPRGFAILKMNGYHAPRQFYIPTFETENEKTRPDYRKTLHWEPQVEITEGKAEFSITTSDESGQFMILSEGITSDGKPFAAQALFTVR